MDLTDNQLRTVHVKRDSRVFRVGNAFGLDVLPQLFDEMSKPFALLLAMDATAFSDKQILEVATQITPKGLIYLCAWGQDCERVHDLFDKAIVPYQKTTQHTFQKLIMTTWHNSEQLSEAAWYLRFCAFPAADEIADNFECIGVSVNNHLWREQIKRELTASP